MNKNEFLSLVEKYTQHKTNSQESRIVENFLDNLNDGIEPNWSMEDEELIELKILRNIQRSRQFHQTKIEKQINPLHRSIPWLGIFKVAASVLLIFAMGFWLYSYDQNPEYITRVNQSGMRSTQTLPDGTIVYLNAESSLIFPETFKSQVERKVVLVGEAFFEVVKDAGKPFIVESGALTTQVLGTSFNINAYPKNDHIQVTVSTGKVQISPKKTTNSPKENEPYFLNPCQQGVLEIATGSVTTQLVSADAISAWKDGVLRFENHTIFEIIPVLERWYGVKIVIDKQIEGACKLRLNFDNISLHQALNELELTAGIKYRKVAAKDYEILHVGCLN